MKVPASAPPPSVAAQCQGSRGTGSLPPTVKQISYINQGRLHQIEKRKNILLLGHKLVYAVQNINIFITPGK